MIKMVSNFANQVSSALIVETDSYAGNFERDMTSYLTGYVGEHYSGKCEKYAKDATKFWHKHFPESKEYDPIFELDYVYSEYGPVVCSIAGEDCKDVAIFFESDVEEDFTLNNQRVLQLLKQRAIEFGEKNNIKIKSVRLESYEQTIKTTVTIVE